MFATLPTVVASTRSLRTLLLHSTAPTFFRAAHPFSTTTTTTAAASFAASAAAASSTMRTIKGVVFDMDGTLTVPCIDFVEMRRRVGIPPDQGDILDVINSWPEPDRRAAAFAAIADVEAQALQDMRVMPGAEELCRVLDQAGVPRGLVTRNVNKSVDFFHQNHFPLPPFSPSLSREWTPYKPDPAALRHIAERWGVPSSNLVMIGDSAKDDVVCGNRAGAVTILLDTEGVWEGLEDSRLSGELRPYFYCRSLHEAAEVLRHKVVLEAPPRPEAVLVDEAEAEKE